MAVSLADAKAHLRVSWSEDDAYITGIVEAVAAHLQAIGVASAVPIQPAVRHASLLMIGHFFNHREAVTAENVKAMPFGVDALLAPHTEVTF